MIRISMVGNMYEEPRVCAQENVKRILPPVWRDSELSEAAYCKPNVDFTLPLQS